MLNRLQKSMDEKDEGFTLIELLVVIVIIGILAAIAIPLFLSQREKADRSAVESDLKNAATQMETYYVDENTYVGATTAILSADPYGYKPSDKVTLVVDTATLDGYCLEGNVTGSSDEDDTFHYDSNTGGLNDGACPGATTTP